jgi:hypothetical protein
MYFRSATEYVVATIRNETLQRKESASNGEEDVVIVQSIRLVKF